MNSAMAFDGGRVAVMGSQNRQNSGIMYNRIAGELDPNSN